MTSPSGSEALEPLDVLPSQRQEDRAIAVHECGHAIVGILRNMHILGVALGEDMGGTLVMGTGEVTSGVLQMLYAGYCAEVEFGIDPVAATRHSRTDMLMADLLFPRHSPAVEVAKTRSIVRYHKDVIDQASRELLIARRLWRTALLRLLKDA